MSIRLEFYLAFVLAFALLQNLSCVSPKTEPPREVLVHVWSPESNESEAPYAVSSGGFLRLTDISRLHVSTADTRSFYVGTESREVLFSPFIAKTITVDVDSKGEVYVDLLSQAPPLGEGALGWRINLQYKSDTGDLKKRPRSKYIFIPRNAVQDGSTPLKPFGKATQYATLSIKPVLSPLQKWLTPPIQIPSGARLDLDLGLDVRWPVEQGGQLGMRVAVVQDSGTEVVLDEVVQVAIRGEEHWESQQIDLASYTGKVVRLAFSSYASDENPADVSAFPLWGNPVLYGKVDATKWEKPNVIIVSLDTLRADRLGCYGYAKGTSPHIDQLATKSMVFENAIASSCWTTPSHASLFTGFSPNVHRAGVWSAGFALRQQWTTLAEIARQKGFRTAAFTEGVAIRGEDGFDQGFESYSDSSKPQHHEVGKIEHTLASAQSWLDANGAMPYFLFIHSYEVHAPYGGPESWAKHYLDPEFSGPIPRVPEAESTPAERRLFSQVYDGGIRYMDHAFGKFLEGLAAGDHLENTVLIHSYPIGH